MCPLCSLCIHLPRQKDLIWQAHTSPWPPPVKVVCREDSEATEHRAQTMKYSCDHMLSHTSSQEEGCHCDCSWVSWELLVPYAVLITVFSDGFFFAWYDLSCLNTQVTSSGPPLLSTISETASSLKQLKDPIFLSVGHPAPILRQHDDCTVSRPSLRIAAYCFDLSHEPIAADQHLHSRVTIVIFSLFVHLTARIFSLNI